jgi:hypothetical protein
MFKGMSQSMLTVGVLYSGPFVTLPLPLTSHHPFFTSFQYTSLCPLPSLLMLCDITNNLSFSFPFFLSQSSIQQFYCYKHVDFVYMFMFGSLFYIQEKTPGFWVSDPGLLHLTWYPPITCIYLQTTYHYWWLSNTALCIYTTMSWSICLL